MGRSMDMAAYWNARSRYKWVVSEIEYHGFRADFIAFGGDKIVEIEVKESWSDYQRDKKKSTNPRWSLFNKMQSKQNKKAGFHKFGIHARPPDMTKYEWLMGDYPAWWKPTHFVYAAPQSLAEKIAADPEKPGPFGVWYAPERSDGGVGSAYSMVNAKRLCKIKPEWISRYKDKMFERLGNQMMEIQDKSMREAL